MAESELYNKRLSEVLAVVTAAGEGGASVADVAKSLGLQVTPYLRGLLDKLVELDYLVKLPMELETGSGRRLGWVYYLVKR